MNEMRVRLVSELAKEVLGPRFGVREELVRDPRSEYITGVLSPKGEPPSSDPDTESELVGELQEYDEDNADVGGASYDFAQPVLDPRTLPHSMGVSFTSECEGPPSLEVCATWARYYISEPERWRRQPRAFVAPISFDQPGLKRVFISSTGKECKSAADAEISLHLTCRRMSEKLWHLSVYLINEIRFDERPRTEDHIYQPQLRIKTVGNVAIKPEATVSADTVERELDFLYREKAVMGRGHLCSAVWKATDPEREAPTKELEEQRPQGPPFRWVDGDVVGEIYGEKTRNAFETPDLRTEFVPIFPVMAPDLTWEVRWGECPELSAKILSETFDQAELKLKLSSLVDGYEKWISSLESVFKTYEDQYPVTPIVSRCNDILRRMRWGLDLLLTDEDARLAFCFGNKALDLQSQWTRKEGMTWHPFQLAYVLLVLESTLRSNSSDRNICDLLWVPTGAGKTEAYLLISAIVLAYRRREAHRRKSGDRTGGGVAVISRYTLRLLTIQQFRRTLKLITACEFLRVNGLASGSPVGWRPAGCKNTEDFIWGSSRFSIGLWVGGSVRPNRLGDTYVRETGDFIPGANSILKGSKGEGEPAQILNCPVCDALLALPEGGLEAGQPKKIHFVVETEFGPSDVEGAYKRFEQDVKMPSITVNSLSFGNIGNAGVIAVVVTGKDQITSEEIDQLWTELASRFNREGITLKPLSARPSRPGYFIRTYLTSRATKKDLDFEIYCPNPDCDLNHAALWAEGVPLDSGWIDVDEQTGKSLKAHGKPLHDLQCKDLDVKGRRIRLEDGTSFRMVSRWTRALHEGFAHRWLGTSIPIPALVVDEQIYGHPPSFLISTVDKFARLPFEPRCAALFGNIEFFHSRFGYYRGGLAAFGAGTDDHPSGAGGTVPLHVAVPTFSPPDLIIQDELHLIEGPLGSLTGIYEVAIDTLTTLEGRTCKYVASTATIKRAEEQVQAVFARRLLYFPAPGNTCDDRFFLRFQPRPHPIESEQAGQLYAGVCAFGKGPLTPLIRVWSRLMQSVYEETNISNEDEIDPFWTIAGYFNAVRELAGARNLYRQDIPERVDRIGGSNARPLHDENVVELSSRSRSTELPSILTLLERRYPTGRDALFTTSMFGTGVDIPRLSLMVVNGQPKTSSAYIQATGRVGRRRGALVVVMYRATRPRDLSHYEFFSGYHGALHRFVEDITVAPFSPGALGRATGPVVVGILRNMRNSIRSWYEDSSAPIMAANREAKEVSPLPALFENRSRKQPINRLPSADDVLEFANSRIDDWKLAAMEHGDLKYVEYFNAKTPVVLGDPEHDHKGIRVVYHNAPQSLRDVEETTGFQT
jgi:hypothetical protein